MALATRADIRKKIAELYEPIVIAAGASTVLAYQPSVIGATPGVYIRTMSSDRPPLTTRGKATHFEFHVLHLVLQADPDNENWTEDKAEDLVDVLEAALGDFLTQYRRVEDYWQSLEYGQPSKIEHFYEEGLAYILEAIPIVAEVF